MSRTLSRRSFLAAGGALVVWPSLARVATGPAGAAPVSPFASSGPPDPAQVDSYLAVHADGTVSVKTGRVELGQGSSTGLLILAAEELDVELGSLIFVRHDTNVTPDSSGTIGSSSIAAAGPMLRSAAATARQALLALASARLGVPVGSLTTAAGVVSSPAGSVSYAELVGGRLFSVPMAQVYLGPGVAPSKPVADYRLVGIADVPRIDIPAKVTGTYTYVHNLRVPGMLHGRVVRPLGQGAYGAGSAAGVVSIDDSALATIGDARVVRRGDFVGVVASVEYDAIQAASALRVVYRDPPEISGDGNLFASMRAFEAAGEVPARVQVSIGDVDAAVAVAAHTVAATYAYDYQGHMPIGPSCAVADVGPSGAIVMANTQDAYTMRLKLQSLLGLPLDQIRVQYWEGASSFGNSPARYDTGEAAAVMSQLAGAPVRLQFMRWDENGWDNYCPAILGDARAAADANGKLLAFDYTAYAIPEMSMLVDATTQNVGQPLFTDGMAGAATANAGTQYDIPNVRIVGKSLPVEDNYFRTSALRGPHAPQTTFACEQLIDELAHAAGMDPYLFRLENATAQQVNDGIGQWRDVLVAAAELAHWEPRVAASRLERGDVVTGRGIAIGGFSGSQAAAVAEIQVSRRTGKITVQQLYAAQVAGLAVYLGGIRNQLEGNLVMATSRALLEQVRFGRSRSLALDWSSYPILRFRDHPNVATTLVQRTDLAPTGSGEPLQAPVPAAIANAFFDATGVRIREAPMTAARVRAVLA